MKKRVFLFIISLIVPSIMLVKSIQFDQNCGGFIKQCADASSIELALDRLNIAIDYVEKNNLTTGYTSAFWKTEDENLEFWYQNLKTCQKELTEATQSTDQLLQTNVLMKVRETLLDDGKEGVELTIPGGIHVFPDNLLYTILFIISAILFFISFCDIDRW